MKRTTKRDKHTELVEHRARKSTNYRKAFSLTLQQIDLALLVREMREDAGLTQSELARKVGTTQSVIARLEDAEYAGHSLTMLERIATACGVALKLRAEKNLTSTAKSRSSSCTWAPFQCLGEKYSSRTGNP
jgi:ribosome-binding protein aMBF1 (putative translation factor)